MLGGANTYTGGTLIQNGVVQVASNANLGAQYGALSFSNGTLRNTAAISTERSTSLLMGGGRFDTQADLTLAGLISGSGALYKIGASRLTLTANNMYDGGTVISNGTLQLGNGGTTGGLYGDIVNGSVLAFNRSNTWKYSGAILGEGVIEQIGTGATVLNGDSSAFTGMTNVRNGALLVNGKLGGSVDVLSGGSLGGIGQVGSTRIRDGGVLIGYKGDTLNIVGDLVLDANAQIHAALGDPDTRSLFNVTGDLVLDGILNIEDIGGFSPGVYRLIDYAGALTDNGLKLGVLPVGANAADIKIQLDPNQVNLINATGVKLNFWDGPNTTGDGVVNGGSGVWNAASGNWTAADGVLNGTWSQSFAVFQSAPGTVQVDASLGPIKAEGMQFVVDGYRIQGDAITLTEAQSLIRVGSGSQNDRAGTKATIASVLAGAGALVKTDLGTLILEGQNTYAGGTAIHGGTIQVSSDGNLGARGAALGLHGGALKNTAAFETQRTVGLSTKGGTFVTDADLTLAGVVAGPGALHKEGAARLIMTAYNTYEGGTVIDQGVLQLGAGGTTGWIKGSVVNNDSLSFNRSDDVAFDQVISGSGSVEKLGSGVLKLEAQNTYAMGTWINNGVVEISSDGNLGDWQARIGFNGGLLRNTAALENRRDTAFFEGGGGYDTQADLTLRGLISGPGVMRKLGDATLTLTMENFHDGGVIIEAGTLQLGEGGEMGSIRGDIVNNSRLVFNRTNTLNFTGAISGSGVVEKLSEGVLVLEGQNTYAGGTLLREGVLQVAADGNLGAKDGLLTFDGGTLRNTAAFETQRKITLNAPGGVFDTQADLKVSSVISGPGALTKQGAAGLILSADNAYAGGTTINAGILQLGDGGAAGSIKGDVVNNGQLYFNRSDAFAFDGVLSGTGGVQQVGSGTTTLSADSRNLTGLSQVQNGVLAVNGVLGGTMRVVSGRLQGTGTVGATTLEAGGVIAPGNSIGTLTINGGYVGNGGLLQIETVLGDDASATDLLAITGPTSGATNVKVVNLGGAGAQTQDGIRIISVSGASNGVFTLQGDYVFQGDQAVVGGAYAYRLFQHSPSQPADGHWYLRSSLIEKPKPLYQPGTPIYENYPQALLGLNSLPTLQQRIGNRTWDDDSAAGTGAVTERRGVWSRVEGAYRDVSPRSSTTDSAFDQTFFKAHAGVDEIMSESTDGALVAGASVHYVHGKTNVRSVYGDGDIRTEGFGLAGALTWYGANGVYLDGQAQTTWYKSDLKSRLVQQALSDRNHGFGYGVSVEGGKRFALNTDWSLTPQAQLAYSSVSFDTFTDVFDARVRQDRGESLQTRVGLALSREASRRNAADGTLSRSHVYGIANLSYDAMGDSRVDVDHAYLASRHGRTAAEIGLGGSYNWNDDRYAVFGASTLGSNLKDFGDTYAVKAQIGFRMKW
ncbi:autotransporter outer membrane beta-barrel domain-containing protein [Brevundimonas diminuta]|uniref:autotransporter outer membrane beta-barrel domain-containing protein n=1 Tax=Brevundimonas diminuta TaxID=293 RepID=UPI003D33B8CD